MYSDSNQIAESISQPNKKHDAYDKHVCKQREFANQSLGPQISINNRDDYRRHINQVLNSSDTECFAGPRANIYYHGTTNTAVVIPVSGNEAATAFRPGEHKAYFDKKLRDARDEGMTTGPLKGGINTLPAPGNNPGKRSVTSPSSLKEGSEMSLIGEKNTPQNQNQKRSSQIPQQTSISKTEQVKQMRKKSSQEAKAKNSEKTDPPKTLDKERKLNHEPNDRR